jgi:hypothetical protein
MAVEGTESHREDRAVEATECRRGSLSPWGEQRPQGEYRAMEGTRFNLFKAIIASRLSRLSLKLSFLQNNDYHDKSQHFFAKNNYHEKLSEMIIIINSSRGCVPG